MGTRSITRVHLEGKDSPVILALYRQYDGYFDGMGADLKDFLKDFKMVNGMSLDDLKNKKVANGMDCLAAQLVAHFKTGPGEFYIYPADCDDEEYNYDVYVDDDINIVLEGRGHDGTVILLREEKSNQKYTDVAEFVYESQDSIKWRKIGVLKETDEYIEGLDLDNNNDFKKFRKDRIIDERIIRTTKV